MYPDPVAGLCGFSAIVLALLQRDRTGEGQYIDLSMQEANFTFIGDAWLEYELNADVRGPLGNSHPLHAPHGIFPSTGEDQWIAIAVESDPQWESLCDVLGVAGTGYRHAAQRKAGEAEINKLLSAKTAQWDKHQLAASLCELGVFAAPVLNAQEVLADTALRERGHIVEVDHPEVGKMWQSGLAACFSRTPGGVTRPAPLQGEHSFAVFRQLLGMERREYERLEVEEVTGKGPTSNSTVERQA
jgi:benzylsuccinate CoA-transferase BbsF subunit